MPQPRLRRHMLVARARFERGAVAVEFALVLPLLVMLLVGTVGAGVALSQSIGLTNAVREGARFGATTTDGGSWGTDVVARTGSVQFDDPGATTQICAQLRKVGGTALRAGGDCTGLTGPTSPAGFTAGECFVWVAGKRNYAIVLGLWPTIDGVMTRSSVSRFERPCP